jgi:hypothetical protein
MSADLKDKAVSGLGKVLSGTWRFTVNTARRGQILGLKGVAFWQQRKIDRALGKLGAQTFKALEQGESNPITAPGVNEALQRAKSLKEAKEKKYVAMEAIRERIRASKVKAPPPPPPAPEPEPAPAPEAAPEPPPEGEKPPEPGTP